MLPKLRRLREIRQRRMLSQKELADKAQMTRVAITRLEGGDVDARFATVRKLAAALDVEPLDLVGDQTPPAPGGRP